MALTRERLLTGSAQLTNTVLMIRPDQFGFNDQTASTNSFQNPLASSSFTIRKNALLEFKKAVGLLTENGINIVVCPSRKDAVTPDAVFPNNWISFHQELDGINTVLYPMMAPNRRTERQFQTIEQCLGKKFDSSTILDLTYLEKEGNFLEGTGSLIFERNAKIAFAHESARTSFEALREFCDHTGYQAVKFHAFDKGGAPIYHTNVVMTVGEGFSVVCLDAISDLKERITVEGVLKELLLDIVPINLDQLHSFCGNILEVKSTSDRNKIIMSVSAYDAFTGYQKDQLATYGDLVPINIPTIETIGGGSARCIMAEVFPPKN